MNVRIRLSGADVVSAFPVQVVQLISPSVETVIPELVPPLTSYAAPVTSPIPAPPIVIVQEPVPDAVPNHNPSPSAPTVGANAAENIVLLQPGPAPEGVFQLLVVPPAQPHTTSMLPVLTFEP